MAESSPPLQHIQDKLGSRVLSASGPQGDDVVVLDRAGLRESFRLLKEDAELSFNLLSDITAVDYWQRQEPRFEVVYQLVSLKQRRRLRVRDHPDLRRILLYDEFTGHPLRKDYPVNLCQPRVPERHVDGTFVDERSHNKLLRLQKTLAKKS